MFPDPEAFNPLRWLEPAYPTFQEPLTQYPTILNCTQFGYGRRLCQGQTVADEDLLIGIGSIAWLFDISKLPEDKVASSMDVNRKGAISPQELNIGPRSQNGRPSMEQVILSTYAYPGSRPEDEHNKKRTCTSRPEGATLGGSDNDEKAQKFSKHDPKTIDPTLDFTTLLIAKPVPFKFSLTVRNRLRAEKVQRLFQEGIKMGDYKDDREFWGADQGKGQPLGWGKV
jgi:hypothetical protein